MTEDIVAPVDGVRKKPFRIFKIAQWLVTAFFAVILLGLLADIKKLGIPGAPIAMFWTVFTVIVIAAIIFSPLVFFRLPLKVKFGIYAGGLTVLVLLGTYTGQMKAAYERTPEGAAEAKVAAAKAAEQAEADAVIAKADAIAKGAEAQVAQAKKADEARAENDRKLDKCFSFFGHGIPKLTSEVKESLQNPSSFEYIRTDKIGGSDSTYNVELFFRAENGFSAIRSVSVQAKINPDDCSVDSMSKIYD